MDVLGVGVSSKHDISLQRDRRMCHRHFQSFKYLKCRSVRGRPHRGTPYCVCACLADTGRPAIGQHYKDIRHHIRGKDDSPAGFSPFIELGNVKGTTTNGMVPFVSPGFETKQPTPSQRNFHRYLSIERTNTEFNRFPKKTNIQIVFFRFSFRGQQKTRTFLKLGKKKNGIEKRERWKSFE